MKRGTKHSQETIEKMRKSHKGQVSYWTQKPKEELDIIRNKISKFLTGKPAWNKGKKNWLKITQEYKKKMSKIAKTKGFGKWMIGRKLSLEHRQNIGKGNLGRKNKMKGRKLPKWWRNKISQGHKGKHIGSNNNSWKGGVMKFGKYYYIWNPKHPYPNRKGYVRRSRFIMEKHLGRFLEPEEIVHHIDFDTTNDNIDNLMLFPSNGAHVRFHRQLKGIHSLKVGSKKF